VVMANTGKVDFVAVEELVAAVADGDRVGVGGALLTRLPLVALHALAARSPRDLTYVSWGGGIPLEILLGADAIAKIVFCFSSLDIFGLAPLFRAVLEEETVEVEEWPAFAFTSALEAAKQNLPAMPFRRPGGSDLIEGNLPIFSVPELNAPFSTMFASRIDLDVFILHAQRADELGNVEFTGARGMDALAPFAASRVLVTVEEVVPAGDLGQLKESFVLPRHFVHQIAVAPHGAYPSSCLPYYIADFAAIAQSTSVSPPIAMASPSSEMANQLRGAATLTHQSVRSAVERTYQHSSNTSSGPASVDEVMAWYLAKRLDNTSIASAGAVSPLAVTSYLLAKALHAPELLIMMTSGGLVDVALRPMLLGLGEALDTRSAAALCGGEDTYRWFYQQGRVTCEVVTVAQLDRRGRTNNIEVVSPRGRRVRLPGQGGMADVADLHRDFILYLTRQSPLSFVETVDRVSASRSLHLSDERMRAGLVPGETALITNLGVFDFDLVSREFVLKSAHPGVTVDEVRQATGFEVTISSDLSETESPPADVLRVLREEVDPLGIRRLEFVAANDRRRLLNECIKAERQLVELAMSLS
jgi:glutaconate CoA-transferase subunit A